MPEPWIDSRVPECRCPFCNQRLDGATGHGTPDPGDVSVCIQCASPLRFADDLTVCLLSSAEFAKLDAVIKAKLHQYMAIVRQLDRTSEK